MRFIFSLGVFFLFSFPMNAQDNFAYAFFQIPDSLKENAHEVVRLSQEKFTVTSPKKGKYRIKSAITILDQKSKAKKLVVHYDPKRKITLLKAKIYDASGRKVKQIPKKEVKDYSSVSNFSIYEDDRIKVIDFFHNSYPYTIEYEYEIIYNGIQSYPLWNFQSHHAAIETASYELEIPPSMEISFRSFNTTITPETSTTAVKKYLWKASHLKAISPESYSEHYYSSIPWVAILPHDFEVEGYKGSMENWKSYGAFMHRLNEGRDQLSPEMAAQVKSLTANAKTDVEKIQILYAYLQKNTRYVSVQLGIGGWQTFDAHYVEKNKYGDCKALTNFMKSMLIEAGIKAYPTLISAGNNNFPIQEDFALPYFNHVILNIPSEDIWLECTSNNYPINYIGAGNADRNVLRYTEKGGELIRTPKSTADDNKLISKVSIDLQASGEASVLERSTLLGVFHERYRYYAANLSEEDQKKRFLERTPLSSCTIQKWNLKASASEAKVERTCDLSIGKYASRAGKRLFVPLNGIHPFSDIPEVVKDRKTPIHIDVAYSHEDEFTFTLPEGYELESYPQEPIELNSPFGKYQVKIELEERKLIYSRKLRIKSGEFPAEEYESLRAFYKEMAKKDGLKIVLLKKVIKP